ncbi:MAG: hypothetical protein K9H49_09105 [Bacteroidales bacterium]|nr:hypothetical protein [Bacteroidales bacterium]MCF8392076.1 hypothetical protein [Bacteroidales bacterium]
MKKSARLIFGAIFIFLCGICISAQESQSNGKALNFPAKKYGISIGNSHEFSGLRINFSDQNVKVINGVNVTFWLKRDMNSDAVVNGISVGLIPAGGNMRFINLGILGTGAAKEISGLNIGGGFIGSGGKINGLCLSGLVTMADGENSAISGLVASGIGIGTKGNINGIGIAGIAIGAEKNINGLAASMAYISANQEFNGLAVTPGYLKSQSYTGVSIAGFSKTEQMNGLSLGLINKTKDLHGIQLGLLNIAENNPKWLRTLPLINIHF